MQANSNATDPWMQTIGLLSLLSGVPVPGVRLPAASTNKPACKVCRPPVPGEGPRALVTLIDRPNASTATISWRDSTRCCYGDQVWRASRARVKGVCAMNGCVISPSDAVFKPGRCRTLPLNVHAMILTSILDDVTST